MSRVDRPSNREVVFSRLIDAPPELVWSVWSDVRHLHEWFGPSGFTTTTHEFSFVPGGSWRFVMHAPDGTDIPNHIVFREIVPPSRLVYENGWGLPDAPLHFDVVVSLTPEGSGTRLSIHMTFPNDEALRIAVERYGVLPGGTQTLERIAGYTAAIRA